MKSVIFGFAFVSPYMHVTSTGVINFLLNTEYKIRQREWVQNSSFNDYFQGFLNRWSYSVFKFLSLSALLCPPEKRIMVFTGRKEQETILLWKGSYNSKVYNSLLFKVCATVTSFGTFLSPQLCTLRLYLSACLPALRNHHWVYLYR